MILRQGDLSDHVLLVCSGFAKVVLTSGDSGIVLALREAPEIIGEQEAIAGGPRFASVLALTEVSARAVSAGDLRALVAADPEAARALARTLSDRLTASNQARRDQAAFTVTQRTARQLVALADRLGAPDEATGTVRLPVTQQDLAAWVGASREAVVKVLRQLRGQGTVATERKTIVIHDLAALRATAAL